MNDWLVIEGLKPFIQCGPPEGISALWIKTQSDRESLKKQIEAALFDTPTLVICVRSRLFENPDSVGDDLACTLAEYYNENSGRREFLNRLTELIASFKKLNIILLSRRELDIPQTSSPCACPDWVPIFGGKLTYTAITDLSYSLKVPLSVLKPEIESVARELYILERVLRERIRSVYVTHKTDVEPLAKRIFGEREFYEKLEALFNSSVSALSAVTDPLSFRVKTGAKSNHFLGQMDYLWCRSTPDNWYGISKDLARALGLSSNSGTLGVETTLVSVIFRIRNQSEVATESEFSHSILINAVSATSLLLAYHHADQITPVGSSNAAATLAELGITIRTHRQQLEQLPSPT
jgi:hypothetical protein